MTEIVAGHYVTNDQSKTAMGGTEQIALRMINTIPQKLLEPFQIIHSRVRALDPGLKRILVCHDLPNDPEVQQLRDPQYRKQFSKIVFVSNWQAQMYNAVLGIPYSEFEVIRNGIEPFPEATNKVDLSQPIRMIYHTTPHRGLELLVPIFVELSKNHNIHLDVFSSFEIYGWKSRDQQYQQVFEDLKALPNVTYYGFQTNAVVREALQKAHVFLYPNIWPETSCIALIEAMCAGVACIHPNYAALPETSLMTTLMYQWDEDPSRHAQKAYQLADAYLNTMKNQPDRHFTVAQTSNRHYNAIYDWNNSQQMWLNLLRRLSDVKGQAAHHQHAE